MKKIISTILLLLFIGVLLMPITGVILHKILASLLIIFMIVHLLQHSKTIKKGSIIILLLCLISFFTGIFAFKGNILLINLHKIISIIAYMGIAIHLFKYHKALIGGRKSEKN